jgi:hypothetical protein
MAQPILDARPNTASHIQDEMETASMRNIIGRREEIAGSQVGLPDVRKSNRARG